MTKSNISNCNNRSYSDKESTLTGKTFSSVLSVAYNLTIGTMTGMAVLA